MFGSIWTFSKSILQFGMEPTTHHPPTINGDYHHNHAFNRIYPKKAFYNHKYLFLKVGFKLKMHSVINISMVKSIIMQPIFFSNIIWLKKLYFSWTLPTISLTRTTSRIQDPSGAKIQETPWRSLGRFGPALVFACASHQWP